MYFQIWKSSRNNQWYWSLRASNHATIATSGEGYWNKSDCMNGIMLVRKAATAPIYDA